MRLHDLLQPVPHILYDTITVPLPCEPGFEFALFRDLMGKTREQTNFDTPLRIHAWERFKLKSVVVKASDDVLWGATGLTLKADDRKVFGCPLAHFEIPLMANVTFEDNTDIYGRIFIRRPIPGTGTANVRVELHGLLAKPVSKD